MTGIAAVGIHNNFAARQSRISLGPAHHKFASGVDKKTSIGIRLNANISKNRLYNHSPKVFLNFCLYSRRVNNVTDRSRVLGRNQNRINSHRLPVFVGNSNLAFAIRPQIGQLTSFPHRSQLAANPVR